MQFGQVPIQFIPDAPVINTNAITMEADTGDTITPSRPGEPPPAIVEEPAIDPGTVGTFVAIAALLAFAWIMANPRR